jgi:hypothetical protein
MKAFQETDLLLPRIDEMMSSNEKAKLTDKNQT